ncbi:hypothetical protein GCM10010156_70320 [Planobispora rosea]|uniref:Uncharacterized protein n=1 Tax=Planobispora rosea TaxID=35762 RepID=A0A8J3S551_PLARO|nr:hypothetical protein [Planobispora rosea]GGT02377.1 hypothetical protein GCM10010156_70320 [Planobispora rosea]GIH88556.1 hypothetical protein Pro02_69640 [Planobispora rosea]
MNIADLARLRDEDLAREPVGQASGAGARALMEAIMAEERAPVRPRPRWVRLPVRRGATWRGLPVRRGSTWRGFSVRQGSTWRRGVGFGVAAVGLAVALVVGTPFGGPATEYANAAVSLKTGEEFLEVVINDPEADAATFTEAFRAVGLDAEVKKVPVAPEDVGTLVGPATPGDFPPGTGVTTARSGGSCPSVWCGKISMPVRYTGRIVFGVGRLAAPGEPYAVPVQIIPIPPDGSPDGYEGRGKPVSEVRAEMERRGMKIKYSLVWLEPDGSGHGYTVDADRVRDHWIVESGLKRASDTVELRIEPGPDVPPDSVPRADEPLPRGWWED